MRPSHGPRDPLDVHVVVIVLLDHPPQHIVHPTILRRSNTAIVLCPERAVHAAHISIFLLSVNIHVCALTGSMGTTPVV